ncbi:MAG TPA: ribosome biogenesis GTPase Der [Bacillota bacterium]|nr:ribosome biogenesis GTPase Der [Bacillota bacterium]HPF42879.1 ribosome biogenesis GTPase Der [Bacillota bacterium]HPJ85368.1 ribosome biogenesis GTPase Der [Bacillota bacterium]HPQ61336.1 ribosome biogenesis GTPase Der [Bacillota bacterium]HRX91945.1 ribosome biogenesis GTPase Der [Candidatus Izemoplasmatales bacterium]
MAHTVAIVGRPNVGKSTIFNRIVGQRMAITDDASGATRDRIYAKASWFGHTFSVIDTGGIEKSDAPFLSLIKSQAEVAIMEADVIIFVVDGKTGPVDDDVTVMKILFKSAKPIIVAVNKADNEAVRSSYYDFYSLGATDIIPVSGIHGTGFGDLMEKVIEYFPEKTEEDYPEEYCKIAVIGRPNVGKSQLTNAILGYDRVIVSDQMGTTTDSIDTTFERDEKKYVIIDTAGLRKRGKIYEGIEKYSALRAMEAIERADVCLITIDASEGILEQDTHIAGYALENGKAMVIVVNKTDLMEDKQRFMAEWRQKIAVAFSFMTFVPTIFLSAKTKSGISEIFPKIDTVYSNYSRRVQTSVLNEVLSEAIISNPPKEYNHRIVKVYYATQAKTKCPAFILFVNSTDCMHFSYRRYLENRLRERFDFSGTPIKLVLRNRD